MDIVAAGNFSFKHRGLLLPIAILLLLVPSPRFAIDPAPVGVIGLLLALLGQTIRIATIGLAYIIRGGKDHRVYADDLVTTGMYAHCRNPMYLGNFFILAALAIASNSWLFLVVGVPIAATVHALMIVAEESFLGGKFGAEFDAYCERVPRFLPRLAGLSATFRAMPFTWSRVLLQEYTKPLDYIAAIALVALTNLWRTGMVGRHPALASMFLAIFVLRLAFWIASRRLQSVSAGDKIPH